MKIHKRLLIASILSTALTSFSAYASDYSGNQFWLNLGLGAGRSRDLGGFAMTASGNYRLSEHQLITARILQTEQFLFDDSRFTDAGLMYGLIAKSQYAYVSGSAGLGWAQYHHDYFENYRQAQTMNRVGIPLEVQAFITPTPYFGIGIIGFSNINSAKVVSGAMLALQVGILN